MRVAIFFDGKNFYRALQHYDPSLQIDYELFADWVTKTAAGPTGVFVGAYYYYTGHFAPPSNHLSSPPTPGELFTHFLRGLEHRTGYFVRREPRVSRTTRCKLCKRKYSYKTEKRVDTRMVAELIHYAAVDATPSTSPLSGREIRISFPPWRL